jgi:RNA recognition motif-containing protein
MPVRLFVGNLSYDATEAELREHFGTIGPVTYCYLPTDRETGRPRGFAFVEYGDDKHAQDAIARLNNQAFRGRPLAVKEA